MKEVKAWIVMHGSAPAEGLDKYTKERPFAVFSSHAKAIRWKNHWRNKDSMQEFPCKIIIDTAPHHTNK